MTVLDEKRPMIDPTVLKQRQEDRRMKAESEMKEALNNKIANWFKPKSESS